MIFADRKSGFAVSILAVQLALVAACSDGGTPSTGTGTGTDTGTGTGNGTGADSAFTSGANSILSAAGPARVDSEGIAPTPASTSVLTWKDARGSDRRMVLGGYLYQYDFSFVGGLPNVAQPITRSANDDAFGHPGFGYVVSHNSQTGNSPIGKGNPPSVARSMVLAGGHHAIHRVELVYDRDREGGGYGVKIPVVIEWFVATGRDHPVWAVTWKMGAVSNPNGVNFDLYRMDTRGPYGSLNFDGAATRAAGDVIGGVGWGDFGLRFATSGPELTLASPWRYDLPNTVAFTQAWTANTNAEMGIVQTRSGDREMGYPDRVVGRERGATSATVYTAKSDCTVLGDTRVYALPCVTGWPYQLMNYDWDPTAGKPSGESTGTKLIAWGTPYGWLGASSFDLFDYSAAADGRGDRSYATFVVLGPKCRFDGAGGCTQPGEVATTIDAVRALASATVTGVSAGTLLAAAPRGPGATQTKALSNGYDDTYAAYRLTAAANRVAFTFTPSAGAPVKAPIFVIEGYALNQLPAISVGGAARTVNTGAATSGAFVSFDAANARLWVTLNETVTAATQIAIGP